MEEGLNRVITRHQTTHTQIQLTDEPLPHLLQLILTTPPTEPLPHSLQLILATPPTEPLPHSLQLMLTTPPTEPLPHSLQLMLTTPPTEPLPHSLQLILTTPTHSLLYIHIDWFVAPQPCILTIPVAGGHPTHRWPPNTTADRTETL